MKKKTNTITASLLEMEDNQLSHELKLNVCDFVIAHAQKTFAGVEAHRQLQLALYNGNYELSTCWKTTTFELLYENASNEETYDGIYKLVEDLFASIKGCQPIPPKEEFAAFYEGYEPQYKGGDDPKDIFGDYPIIEDMIGTLLNPKLEKWLLGKEAALA